MSRDLDDHKYYITSGGKIPVKWTAPEVCYFIIKLWHLNFTVFTGPPVSKVFYFQ